MICALIACLHQFFLAAPFWLSLNSSNFTSVARSLRRWWYSEVSFDDERFINIFLFVQTRVLEETWPRVAVRQRDIKIAFRMALTLAYSLVKHGISLNPSVSKTSKCHLGRFTVQLEQTQPVSCKLQLVLQLAFVVRFCQSDRGSIQPTTKQKQPNFRSNDCDVGKHRHPSGTLH